MNKAKYMIFIVCSLMISLPMNGMGSKKFIFKAIRVPLLSKTNILLKIDRLERQVAKLQQQNKNAFTVNTLQPLLDRSDRNISIGETGGKIAFIALMVALYLFSSPSEAFTH